MCTPNENSCRTLEKEFGLLIKEKSLENSITYLNIGNEKKKASFLKDFNKFYNTKALGYPSLIYFYEGKV